MIALVFFFEQGQYGDLKDADKVRDERLDDGGELPTQQGLPIPGGIVPIAVEFVEREREGPENLFKSAE